MCKYQFKTLLPITHMLIFVYDLIDKKNETKIEVTALQQRKV
jgi:hypothetical protein